MTAEELYVRKGPGTDYENVMLSDEKVILVIDTDRLVPEVKWEDGGGLDFPHIYGHLNRNAVVDVLEHLWSPDREWIPNEELKQYAPDGFRREWNG